MTLCPHMHSQPQASPWALCQPRFVFSARVTRAMLHLLAFPHHDVYGVCLYSFVWAPVAAWLRVSITPQGTSFLHHPGGLSIVRLLVSGALAEHANLPQYEDPFIAVQWG